MARFRLPERPNLEHLEKQAKDLLRAYRAGDAEAFARLREALPLAAGRDDAELAALDLQLRDAQSCLAREYGWPTWANLKNYVDWRASKRSAVRADVVPLWLHAVYGHEHDRPDPVRAAHVLATRPDLVADDLMLACAVGAEDVVRAALQKDAAAVNRTGGAWRCPGCKRDLARPPLVAATHSTLVQLPEFRERIRRTVDVLLAAGADPNQSWGEDDHPLSALYGAAGKNFDPVLTERLLAAGANPNDGESLYHSVESSPILDCTRLLLAAGAKVEGTNALHHMLDRDDLAGLELLLAHTCDANDGANGIGSPLFWAIRRRRSPRHVAALLAAGADPRARTKDGVGLHPYALMQGLGDVAELLAAAGAAEPVSLTAEFVAACARGDEEAARALLAARPTLMAMLSAAELRQLPELVEAKNGAAVRLMVRLGWPIGVRGGDWGATALNLAVYQGDAALARYLLEHGASWQEAHGFGDNVNGTLSWASRNNDAERGDWVGCARALVDHGMPVLELNGDYSAEVEEFLSGERAKRRRGGA